MAVSTESNSVSYAGNNSTSTAYTVPFPFLTATHLRVSTQAEDEDAVILSPSAYVVTRLPDGSGGAIKTVAAVPVDSTVIIQRVLPLTQPTTFPLAGPFSLRTNETALDRLLMQIQQVNRRFDEITDAPEVGDPVTAFGRWDTDLAYVASDMATASDGNTYRAQSTHSGANPSADAGTNWKLAIVNSNTTLNVPSRFASIAAAWDFLKSAFIGGAVTVTIQVANGTYSMGTARLNLNHPCGSRIRLVGNAVTPASCVLDFVGLIGETDGAFYEDDWGAINVAHGHTLGWLNGFTLSGPGLTQYGVAGILAFNGARVICGPQLVVRDFYAGVAAVNHSFINCDGVQVSGGGDGNLFVYNGSAMSAAGCTSSGASTWYGQAGAMVEHGSALFAPDSTFEENAGCQVACHFGSTLMIARSILRATGGLVGSAIGVRLVKSDNCDLGSVTYTGVPEPEVVMSTTNSNGVAYMRFGTNVAASPALMGFFQFIRKVNTLSTLSITQDSIATGFLGFTSGSSTLTLANDGAAMVFKVGSSAALGGTTLLTLAGGKATVPKLNISAIPTSASGLVSGDIWSDSGVLTVV